MSTREALVIVDMQAVTLANARTQTPERLHDTLATLLESYRDRGATIVHALSTGTPGGATAYAAGGRSWSTAEAEATIEARDDEIVVRRAAWSAFAGTGLAEALRERGVDTVVVVGIATPFGVESTARDAYDAGFSVVIPTDAVAAPDPAGHEWTLTRVIPALGRTTTVAQLVSA